MSLFAFITFFNFMPYYINFSTYFAIINKTSHKMGKKIKNTPKQKTDYIFVLKGSKGTFYKNKIQADYTPSKCQSSLPVFNKDSNYYTPSFIVPFLYNGNKSDYRSQHENKVQATLQKSQQNILVPRPRPSKNYCGVCSSQYQDYLQHIQSHSHKSSVRNSQYYHQIIKLCQRVKSQNQDRRVRFMRSMNSKSSIVTQAHSQEETNSKDLGSRTLIQLQEINSFKI